MAEKGKNGYVWAVVTDTVRYCERHGTRSGTVPKEMLGEEFCGVVVCVMATRATTHSPASSSAGGHK